MEKFNKVINPVSDQKLESPDNFPGGMAREFTNMLSIILGHTQLSLSEDITPEIKKSLDEIEKAAIRGTSLIQNIISSLSSGTG